ncbi:MAG: flagellar biosynthetic protein FliO [Thalassobaculum sp.]|uniref:FliO/MopB family protein n=1 Tax=Thalassobaculum sp. TaxID=2022740 RepID=UPI0032ECF05D
MDLGDYLRTVFALLFVLGLIGLLYVLARQYGAQRLGLGRSGPGGRLAVVEARSLGARHRLVLVRRDDVEHLLLIGPDRDVVVEAGIPAKASFDAALTATDPGAAP